MTVTFSFKTAAERDRFMKHLAESSKRADSTHIELITEALKNAKFDALIKSEQDKVYSLWVSGQKMVEGQLPEIENKFKLECDSHSASVAIREMKNGVWVDIRKRSVQPR